MENRRRNYRCYFPAPERPAVELEIMSRHLTVTGLLLDLGVEGMRVRLEGKTPALTLDDTLLAHLALPRLNLPLSLACAVVYLQRVDSALDCGVTFLPLLLPSANEERNRLLWNYLMEEQRRQRKQRRGSGVSLKLFTGE